MYKAFLSYAQLKEYLYVIEENGLLEYNSGEETHKITSKGNKFLNVYGRMKEYLKYTEEA